MEKNHAMVFLCLEGNGMVQLSLWPFLIGSMEGMEARCVGQIYTGF